MAVDINIARQAAIDRVITVLQSQLETQLDDVAEGGLYLPVPSSASYHFVRSEGDIATYLDNFSLGVYLWAASPRATSSRPTGGALSRSELTTFNLGVAITFLKTAQNTIITRNGKPLDQAEVQMLMSEKYSGALLKTIYKHAPSTDGSIMRVRLVNDSIAAVYNVSGDPSGGSVRCEFEILQEVLLPRTDYSTV